MRFGRAPKRAESGTDLAARVRLGANPETPAETLEHLAADPDMMVRAALALNPAAPARANQALGLDQDERVRALLARKLAALTPGLSDGDHGQLERLTYETLVTLVEDEAVRVRAAIADVVKQMRDAPRSLILRLARDCAMPVSEPVIRFSPLLTTADLLSLLASPASPATALAIARRPHLNPGVADAIAGGENDEAIRELLGNPSAQIREATLDALIARAAGHEDWHEPLVNRPRLPPQSARALSSIVATQLLEVLAGRADLGPALLAELRQRLQDRLAAAPANAATTQASTTEQAIAKAHRIARSGQLCEQSVLAAIQQGDTRLAVALLAVAADMPVSAIDRAASLRSAKALVSLVWKAGFSMVLSAAVQTALGHLAPSAVLTSGPGGGFPLAVEEMRWQIDLLRRTGW